MIGEASDWVFAWQAGAGAGFELDGGTTPRIGYRHMSAGEASLADDPVAFEAGLDAHIFEVGARIRF